MDTEKLAQEARRMYQREWRRKNPDKVKANNQRYWERQAAKLAAEKEEGHEHDED